MEILKHKDQERVEDILIDTANKAIADCKNKHSFLESSLMTISQFFSLVENGTFTIDAKAPFDLELAKHILYSIITCGTDFIFEVRGYCKPNGDVVFTNGAELLYIVDMVQNGSNDNISPLLRRRILQFQIRYSKVATFQRTEEEIKDIAKKLNII